MKKILLFLAVAGTALFSGAGTARALSDDLINSITTDAQSAKDLVVAFYKVNGSTGVTVRRVFPFKMRNINGYTYLTSKALLTAQMGDGSNSRIMMGVLMDTKSDWIRVMEIKDFQAFLDTGDRALLKIPDLSQD